MEIKYGVNKTVKWFFTRWCLWRLKIQNVHLHLTWVSDCCLAPTQQFFIYMKYFQWDDDEVRILLDQHSYLDFLVLTHWYNRPRIDMSPYTIILIPSQPVFALSHYNIFCVLRGEATNTNLYSLAWLDRG